MSYRPSEHKIAATMEARKSGPTLKWSNLAHPSLIVTLSLEAITGGSVSLTINGKTPDGQEYELLSTGPFVAPGVYVFEVSPLVDNAPNRSAKRLVPLTGDVQVTHATNTDTLTYAIGIAFVG